MIKLTREPEISNKAGVFVKSTIAMSLSLALFLSLTSLSAAGCASLSVTRSYYVAYGRVVQVNTQGIFYEIETESGDKLYPVNLPLDFQQDGIRVRVTYRIYQEPTSQDWGTPIHIIDMRRA